jgi:hypothetical protein
MLDDSQRRVLFFRVGQQEVNVHVLVLAVFDQMVCPVNMQNSKLGSPNRKGHGERDIQSVGHWQDWSPGTQPKHSHLRMCRGSIEWSLSLYRHSDGLSDFAEVGLVGPLHPNSLGINKVLGN